MFLEITSKTHRYGFNGKELDTEGMGGGLSTYDYGFRIYNPAIARFLSVDPLSSSYPWYTPYQFAGNIPIWCIDRDGAEPETATGSSWGVTDRGFRVYFSEKMTPEIWKNNLSRRYTGEILGEAIPSFGHIPGNGGEMLSVQWWLCAGCKSPNMQGLWLWRVTPELKPMKTKGPISLPMASNVANLKLSTPLIIEAGHRHNHPTPKKYSYNDLNGINWYRYDDTFTSADWDELKKHDAKIMEVYKNDPDNFRLNIDLGVSAPGTSQDMSRIIGDNDYTIINGVITRSKFYGKRVDDLLTSRISVLRNYYSLIVGIPEDKIFIEKNTNSVELKVNAENK